MAVVAEETLARRTALGELLAECVRLDASDVHAAPGLPPYFRVHGLLEPNASFQALSEENVNALAEDLARGFDRSPLERIGSLDGAITGPDGTRYRFNIFRRQGQLALAIRRLEDSFRSLSALGMPEALYQLCDLPDGLVVVAGPTGAGKSTTLASLLHRINTTSPSKTRWNTSISPR
jgi:twitching motility protein PilT